MNAISEKIPINLSQVWIETVFTVPETPKVGETCYIAWRTKNWTDVYLEGYWIIRAYKNNILKLEKRYPSSGYSHLSQYSSRLDSVEAVFNESGNYEVCVYFYYWPWQGWD